MILPSGHVSRDSSRCELRRVWVIDSIPKAGTNHDFGHRRFYPDDDPRWIMLVAGYDCRNQIWRQESHDVMCYDIGFMNAAAEFQCQNFNAICWPHACPDVDKKRALLISFGEKVTITLRQSPSADMESARTEVQVIWLTKGAGFEAPNASIAGLFVFVDRLGDSVRSFAAL